MNARSPVPAAADTASRPEGFPAATLERLKWLYPREVAASPEAARLLESVLAAHGGLDHLWREANNPYTFWQAFANVCGSVHGFELAHAILRGHCLQRLALPKVTAELEGILSAIVLLTSRFRRFDEQRDAVELFVGRFPRSHYGRANRMRANVFRGEVELAESEFREHFLALPPGRQPGEKLFWGTLLGLHKLLVPELEQFRAHVARAPHLRRPLHVLERFAAQPPPAIPEEAGTALCVSLPGDHRRLAAARKLFAKCRIAIEVVPGVAGAAIPPTIRRMSASYDIIGGEYGCFASHVAAWEAVARRDRPVLVLEDDAVPAYPFSLPALTEAMPKEAEIVFLNDRCCSYLAPRPPSEDAPALLLPGAAMDGARLQEATLLGSDGYLLTPGGARKLLEMFRISGMTLPLDWHLFVASQGSHFSNRVFPAERTARLFAAVERTGPLRAWFQPLSAITTADFDYSAVRANS